MLGSVRLCYSHRFILTGAERVFKVYSLIAKIPEFDDVSDRLCCMCNGKVCNEDFIWKASEENHLYVCAGCMEIHLKMFVATKAAIEQRKELN